MTDHLEGVNWGKIWLDLQGKDLAPHEEAWKYVVGQVRLFQAGVSVGPLEDFLVALRTIVAHEFEKLGSLWSAAPRVAMVWNAGRALFPEEFEAQVPEALKIFKVYLDDERATPDGWVRVYWPDEAYRYLEAGLVSEISLDHDLGDDARGTGYDVVLWLEEQFHLHGRVPPKISLHTANTSARMKMQAGVDALLRKVREAGDV